MVIHNLANMVPVAVTQLLHVECVMRSEHIVLVVLQRLLLYEV
jgi:hypothetical protein